MYDIVQIVVRPLWSNDDVGLGSGARAMTIPALRTKILLIESDPAIAESIRAALGSPDDDFFDLEWARDLSEGVERLRTAGTAAVLLNLDLHDSQGIPSFDAILAAAPTLAILILGGNISQALLREAIERGAQDYLLPAHLNALSLPRALRNAIKRKAVEEALYFERERSSVTLNSIADAVLCTDVCGHITYLNLIAETMTGWSRDDVAGKQVDEVFQIVNSNTRAIAPNPLSTAILQNRTVGLSVDCTLIGRDGTESIIEDSAAPIHDRAGRTVGGVIVFRDVSIARAMALKMAYLALHDPVTNLPNRILLNDRIAQSISLARRQKTNFAIIFLDLDRFKYINDSLGHVLGDLLLVSVARRLVANVRDSDTVTRLGGDEFVILLSETAHPGDAAISAGKLLLALAVPHFIDGHKLHIDGSIGISVYPGDGEDAETLVKNADNAMYQAKAKGHGNFQFFEAEMNVQTVMQQSVESDLRRALSREEFVLQYQPQVSLKSGSIIAVEALIRWRQSSGKLIYPSHFIPTAEDSGLILQIGRWVMHEACAQAFAWQRMGLPPMPIAVNVSASELRDKSYVATVRRILSETRLEARYLELEFTEGILMDNTASTVAVLQELKSMGVSLAIDDFGTGYSSLSYLRHFPIDAVKIDQSFICQLGDNHGAWTLVNAMIRIGKGLKHRVIAEGIETQVQRSCLQKQSCTEGQGYLFSRPLAAPEFAELLRDGLPRAIASSQLKGRFGLHRQANAI